jgi:hypothetical protein
MVDNLICLYLGATVLKMGVFLEPSSPPLTLY